MEVIAILIVLWIIHFKRRGRKRQPEVVIVVRRQSVRGARTTHRKKTSTTQMVRKAYHTQHQLNRFFKDKKRK